MESKSWMFAIVTVGVLGGALLSAACTTGPTPPSGSSESNLDDQTPSASKPTPSASASSTAPSTAPSAAGAAPSAGSSSGGSPISTPGTPPAGDDDDDACSNACDAAHPTGSDDYDTLEEACICVPSRCAAECAQSECNDSDNAPDPVSGDACDTCMAKFENDDGTGACDVQIEAGLKAKGGDDAALQACYDACP